MSYAVRPTPEAPIAPSSSSLDPADWHRRLCWVADWLAVSGDLDTEDADAARRQLDGWIDAGVTDVLDLRGEWDDEAFVAAHAPGVRYHWLGTDDDGDGQADHWFDAGLAVAEDVRSKGGRLVVHCHMGVNRAPSMAFRMLLQAGEEPVAALAHIRAVRPIAGLIYADSALDHHHRGGSTTEDDREVERRALTAWFDDNPVDLGWVISRIRRG